MTSKHNDLAIAVNGLIEKKLEACENLDTRFSTKVDILYTLRVITAELERDIPLWLYMKTMGH